jgi:hypothetical protein
MPSRSLDVENMWLNKADFDAISYLRMRPRRYLDRADGWEVESSIRIFWWGGCGYDYDGEDDVASSSSSSLWTVGGYCNAMEGNVK